MQHQEVVLVEALRSPIGRLGGQLANVRPDDLLAEVVRQVVKRSGIDPTLIDQVYAGAANQAGEDNRNVARHVAVVFTCLIGCAGVDLVDQCRVDTAALNDLANHLCEQVIRPDIGELTSEPTDR